MASTIPPPGPPGARLREEASVVELLADLPVAGRAAYRVLSFLPPIRDALRLRHLEVAPARTRRVGAGPATVVLHESGSVGPPIVVESGAGGCGVEWTEVADLLAPRHVVRVDRPGLGSSPPAPVARDADASAGLLRDALAAAGIAGPYVLVGHSLAGLECRAFAHRYPDDVAGLVLVDPFAEDTDDDALPRGFAALQQVGLHLAAGLCRLGLRRPLARAAAASTRHVLSQPDRPDTARRLRAIAGAVTTAASFRALAAGAAAVETSRAQLRDHRRASGFPAVPLRVLTPDSPPINRLDALVRAANLECLHPREAASSPLGSHHVVEESSHLMYLDQPHALADHVAAVAEEAAEAAGTG